MVIWALYMPIPYSIYKIVTQENLLLVEKNIDRQKSLSEMNIGKVVTTDNKSISECNIVILAVKPQDLRNYQIL